MTITEKVLNGKAIYSPKGAAKEYGREESIIRATAGDWIHTADAFNTMVQMASINPDIVDNIHNISKQIFEASCVDFKDEQDL